MRMNRVIESRADFAREESLLLRQLVEAPTFDRGEVHAQEVVAPEMQTRELRHIVTDFSVPFHASAWQAMADPNLPWAEDHFKERVGGKPLNPPPAEAWWPYAQQGNSAHKEGEVFSHTYPERFWPKHAGDFEARHGHLSAHQDWCENKGIRFKYGDLDSLVSVLNRNPLSRQAYLPVWFPEDLTAATEGARVPCTLGYHFLVVPTSDGGLRMDMTYHMRSCDIVRFWRDDIYMAGRLLQWVRERVVHPDIPIIPGNLRLTISSLHCFQGDLIHLRNRIHTLDKIGDARTSYNFEGML